ncbi:hypothetical protein FB451DRAFT_1407496 [Mycena latifolia]|nr:hypothetical protein FB451DRAFT_1407496 [Mycena latifolia]
MPIYILAHLSSCMASGALPVWAHSDVDLPLHSILTTLCASLFSASSILSLPLRAAAEHAFGVNSSISCEVHLRESGALDGKRVRCYQTPTLCPRPSYAAYANPPASCCMPTMLWIAANSHWFSHRPLPAPSTPPSNLVHDVFHDHRHPSPSERNYSALPRRLRNAAPLPQPLQTPYHEAESHALRDCGIAQVASAIRCITLDQHYGCALHATPARTQDATHIIEGTRSLAVGICHRPRVVSVRLAHLDPQRLMAVHAPLTATAPRRRRRVARVHLESGTITQVWLQILVLTLPLQLLP